MKKSNILSQLGTGVIVGGLTLISSVLSAETPIIIGKVSNNWLLQCSNADSSVQYTREFTHHPCGDDLVRTSCFPMIELNEVLIVDGQEMVSQHRINASVDPKVELTLLVRDLEKLPNLEVNKLTYNNFEEVVICQ